MPGAVRLTYNTSEIERIIRDRAGPLGKWLTARAERVRAGMITMAPSDRGMLRQSIAIEYRVEGSYIIARIGSNLTYAIYVVKGTGIYGPKGAPIVPVRGKVLAWPQYSSKAGTPYGGSKGTTPSGMAFARSVKGVRPRDFMTAALRTYFSAAG